MEDIISKIQADIKYAKEHDIDLKEECIIDAIRRYENMSKEYDPEYEEFKCRQRIADKRPVAGPCPICGSNPRLLIHYLGKPDGGGYPGCFTFQYKCPECGYLETDDIDSIYRSEEDAVDMAANMWNDYSTDINNYINKTKNTSVHDVKENDVYPTSETSARQKLIDLGVFDKDGNIVDELKDFIVKIGDEATKLFEPKVGFKDDEIFLPSVDEYEKYKDKIPAINYLWWLRSPGDDSFRAASVDIDISGRAFRFGTMVNQDCIGVRPMIHLPKGTIEINAPVGARINLHNFPWVVIDKYLAIAEVPIGFEKFDDNWNDYLTSHIRNYLDKWLRERKEKIN